MKSVEIIINPDGTITMQGKEFQGADCDKAMKELEKSLGIETKRINKPEFYQHKPQNVKAAQ